MPAKEVIYLDYAATTPVDPRVVAAMLPYFNQAYGNPSSIHRSGQTALGAVQAARSVVADHLNCKPTEIIFTSCGTESDNLAIRGTAFRERRRRDARQILISPVEHSAVTQTAQQLADLHGFEVDYLPIDQNGQVDPADVARRIKPSTAVVSVILGNNEIGTINPIPEIGQICREAGIPFHSDAVQAGAYLPLDVDALNVDLLSIGAHKFYGPKGVGALYIRDGINPYPTQTGGGQEFGYRSGTQNVPYIVGLGKALSLAQSERHGFVSRLVPMRERLIHEILDMIPESILTGHPTERLANHASLAFRGVDGNSLLMFLDVAGFACSSGSACHTGTPEPSGTLLAMGYSAEWALGSLRITIGRQTTEEHVDSLLDALPGLVDKARQLTHSHIS